jgi:D-alanine-D-alanine ligase-like ATP-grasp enzyme
MGDVINKKRVGVLRGGEGDHYDKSLKDGGEVILCIRENLADRWQPLDILIDKNNVWHAGGIPIQPTELINKVDVVWNATHPAFSQTLRNLNIPFVGSGSFGSTLGESRAMLEKHMKEIGVKMPRHVLIPLYQTDFDGPRERFSIKKAKEVHEKFPAPWIVRPMPGDSLRGVHLANTFPELVEAIEDEVNHGKSILVEEFISGRNSFMHSVAGFRGADIYTFPAGKFRADEKEKLEKLAKDLFMHLGVAHYLNSNFVVHPKRGIYLTSVEFQPDFGIDSHFNKVCESVGTRPYQILEHLLKEAIG